MVSWYSYPMHIPYILLHDLLSIQIFHLLWNIELENGSNIHLNNILFIPGLYKNLLSISSLEDKVDKVAFTDGKVVVWSKDSSIENARVIGI